MATRRRVPATRKRRSSDVARSTIIDATEAMLREVGPGGIRLQEVAKAVGVSHSTVLHHFGSREGLIDAVVERALERAQSGLVEAVPTSQGAEDIAVMLESAARQLREAGRARTLLWLSLAGYGAGVKGLQLEPLAQVVHTERKRRWGPKKAPPFEDTYFTVLLPTLALLSLTVLEEKPTPGFDPTRFRAWLATLVHRQLESC